MPTSTQAATERLTVSPDVADALCEAAINLSARLRSRPVRGVSRRRYDLQLAEQELADSRGNRRNLRPWLRAYEKLLIGLSERCGWLLVTDWARRLGLDLDDAGGEPVMQAPYGRVRQVEIIAEESETEILGGWADCGAALDVPVLTLPEFTSQADALKAIDQMREAVRTRWWEVKTSDPSHPAIGHGIGDRQVARLRIAETAA